MNYVKRPKEEKVVLRMQQLYLKTERKLINEITRKRALGQVDYAEVAALERVQKILTEMQNEAFEYVPQMVETIFHGEGEKNAAGYENARTLTTAQTDVSQMLINNLLGEIVEASETALESAKTWLSIGRLEADEFRNAALQFTAEQQAAGASWLTAQKNMAVDLQARGITAFVDKAGRQWSLSDYCAMATRTTARQASVAANLTRDDHDLWQISKIGSTCPVCAVYEGRVYSKSGTNPDYPPLAAAFGKIDPAGPDDLTNTYLNIHPNCLHSLMKYTTIGKTDEQIQKDKDFSSFEKNPITHDPRTKKQIKAYREKEKNRRRYIDDYKQWRKYKAAFGDDIPDFERFRAHKLKDDDKYKEWLHDFRSFRAKSAYTEMEASHKVRKVSLQYNRDNLTGTKLRNRLDILGEDETVTREMFDKIKLTLDHRDGTHFEDLTYINTITKKGLINQNYNYYKNGKSECKPSKRMKKMQKAADDYTIIAIHNHPTSTFPSKDDIFSASTKRYKYGIIIAHDGTIYRYKTEPNFNAVGANTYIDILKKRENDMWRKIDGTYTGKETLEQLKYKVHQTVDDLKRFGVIIEVFK